MILYQQTTNHAPQNINMACSSMQLKHTKCNDMHVSYLGVKYIRPPLTNRWKQTIQYNFDPPQNWVEFLYIYFFFSVTTDHAISSYTLLSFVLFFPFLHFSMDKEGKDAMVKIVSPSLSTRLLNFLLWLYHSSFYLIS